MKKFFIIALCLLLASCAVKKHHHETVHEYDSTTVAVSNQEHKEIFADSSRYESGVVIITEITFNDPGDTNISDGGTVTITSDGAITGNNVKSVTQTTIENQVEQKNEIHQISETSNDSIASSVHNQDVEVVTEKKSRNWETIFIWVVVGLCAVYLCYPYIIKLIRKLVRF